MAVTGVTMYPQVVWLGGAREERDAYTTAGTDTIAAGDLIRINDAGTLDLAEAASAGAVHGMALEGDAGSAKQIAILLFAADTIIKIATIDGEAPSDLTKGLVYTLEVTAGSPAAITATTTNGVALVVEYSGTGQPWDDATSTYNEAVGTDNNSVHARILTSVLDGNAAAAT